MEKNIRVRFAPSPTGLLHVGNARTALFNFLFCRQKGGQFVLRLEDTDRQRSIEEAEQAIMADLRWLGIKWDEGPDQPGLYGPYRQSQRLSIYNRYAQELLEKGLAYRCYCLPEELEEKRKNFLARGLPPKYDGRCRSLTAQEEADLINSGRSPSLRFQVNAKIIEFRDLIKGRVSLAGADIGDFIILRSDGMAAYNFAVVIDDSLMEISHVIRGEDHLTNTARQILLYRALGFSIPQFAHLPLILGPDRAPLSKRHGATAVAHFREEGYLPAALLNYLALLGWSPEEGKEIFTVDEIIAKFSLKRVARSPAVFDYEKLKWINRQHLKRVEGSQRVSLLRPFLEREGIRINPGKEAWLEEVLKIFWEEADTLGQLATQLDFFFKDTFPQEEAAANLLQEEKGLKILQALQKEVEKVGEINPATYREIILRLTQLLGFSGRALLLPIRAALTGKIKGPELEKICGLLGKEGILNKIAFILKAKLPERSAGEWKTKNC